jgi:hypothetical protein
MTSSSRSWLSTVTRAIVGVSFGALLLFGAWKMHAQENELARLRNDISSIPHDGNAQNAPTVLQFFGSPAASAAPTASVAPIAETPQITPDERNAQARTRIAAREENLQTSFQSEPIDASWSQSTTRQLKDAVAAKLSDRSSVTSLECRTSTCRLEMKNEDVNAYRSDLHAMLMSPDPVWRGPFFATALTSSANGQLTSVAFLAREGTSLPHDEPQ